ncbi:Iron(3+)-hydroxamate import ATP-binding protein FhuC [compost metagenome]
MLSLVRRMCHEQGRSAIVVLHEVNMAARFSDHIVALKAGRIALQGTPGDLMTPEALARIYGLPMQVLLREDGGHVAIPA